MVLRGAPARALVLALTLTFATSPPGQGQQRNLDESPAPSAVKLIGARCVFCHGPALMLAFSHRMLDAGGPSSLDEFLTLHHAPDREAREQIVKFLIDPIADPDR